MIHSRDIDVRTQSDPRDIQTSSASSALPPVEFRVTKGAAANTFYITDRQAPPGRGGATAYRVYFFRTDFAPNTVIDLAPLRRSAANMGALVQTVPALGKGTVLTATDTQFFGQKGYYFCVAVNQIGDEAPVEHSVALA